MAPPGEDHKPERHHLLLLNKLQEVADGKCKRLMVFMPPGTAKSTYVSKIFPAWLMFRQAQVKVIGASNTSKLADNMSMEVNAILSRHSVETGVGPLSIAKEEWAASNGSEYRAVGVGGTITGFRADYLIIDDPIKSAQEAYSEQSRTTTRHWFNTDAHTRIKPNSAIILMHTRWHVDDLAGQLIEEQGAHWDILNLPAIWEEDFDEPEWPNGMGRRAASGELLWPEYHDEEFYEKARATMGERDFSALYQQSPRVQDGALIQPGRIKIIEPHEVMPAVEIWRAWDFAATEKLLSNRPDYTVGLKLQKDATGRWTVLDVVRGRIGPQGVKQFLLDTAHRDGPNVKISLPIDPGSYAKIGVSDFTVALEGFYVESSPERGKKDVRALPFIAQVNGGNFSMVKARWNDEYVDELSQFPGGRHDDQVDATSRAFSHLITPDRSGTYFSSHARGFWKH